MIDRQQFVEELKLREQIRRAIKIIREKKEAKAKAILEEEMKLRTIIRSLLNEKEGEGDESTGIAFLRRDLKKILPELEEAYTSLRTSVDQRKSYRTHILNAIQNLITSPIQILMPPQTKILVKRQSVSKNKLMLILVMMRQMLIKELTLQRNLKKKVKSMLKKAKEDAELEDFAIAGEDRTGAVEALRSMKQIENVIKKTYNGLFDQNDRDIYADYLITNLQLYFDEFEEELQAVVPEPDNPDYDQRKAADAGMSDTGIQSEDNDPL